MSTITTTNLVGLQYPTVVCHIETSNSKAMVYCGLLTYDSLLVDFYILIGRNKPDKKVIFCSCSIDRVQIYRTFDIQFFFTTEHTDKEEATKRIRLD